MSANIRSLAASALLSGWIASMSVAPAIASSRPEPGTLPPTVASLAPDLRPQGGGELRWLGLPIYDGYFWSEAPEFSVTRPFALDLTYRRDLVGEKIAERSVDEIAKLGFGSAEDRARWGEAMRRIFPDVKRGDRLIGVNLPGRGASFFHNGKPIGAIDDPAFARAFFGIWLDPRTSRPDFRKLLLGER
jgi:hypothetical protein